MYTEDRRRLHAIYTSVGRLTTFRFGGQKSDFAIKPCKSGKAYWLMFASALRQSYCFAQ